MSELPPSIARRTPIRCDIGDFFKAHPDRWLLDTEVGKRLPYDLHRLRTSLCGFVKRGEVTCVREATGKTISYKTKTGLPSGTYPITRYFYRGVPGKYNHQHVEKRGTFRRNSDGFGFHRKPEPPPKLTAFLEWVTR